MKPVVPRARAVEDIEAAVDHLLEEASEEVALSFIDDLERAFSHLAEHPGTGSTRWAYELGLPGLRSWRMRRHPYVVFYLERDDHVDVWRVLHGRRDIPPGLAASRRD